MAESCEEVRLSIGKIVRSLREQRGLTQEELSKATGLGQSYISRLEGQSRNRADIRPLYRIARALNVTPSAGACYHRAAPPQT